MEQKTCATHQGFTDAAAGKAHKHKTKNVGSLIAGTQIAESVERRDAGRR